MPLIPTERPRRDNLPDIYTLFLQKLDELQRRTEACGRTMTDACRDTKLSRATPNRWRREICQTLQKMNTLEDWVEKQERRVKRQNSGADTTE